MQTLLATASAIKNGALSLDWAVLTTAAIAIGGVAAVVLLGVFGDLTTRIWLYFGALDGFK